MVSSQNTALPIRDIARSLEGEDCEIRLLGLLPVSGSLFPSLEEAMDRALEQVPEGNVMTSIAVYSDVLNLFLVTQVCTRVKGDVGTLE